MSALTHQERAIAAAKRIHSHAHPEWTKRAVEAIARETFPRELVEAARKRAGECSECQGDSEVGKNDDFGNPGSMPCDHCADLRDALALYEETP